MVHWRRLVSAMGERRVIGALGVLYVVFAIGRALAEFDAGVSPGSILIVSLLIAVPGSILAFGAFWLSRSDIDPEYYVDVVSWSLVGFGVIVSLLILFHLQPEGGISDPLSALPILTALGSVAGFGVGVYDGRAKTRARQLRRRAHQQRAVADLGQFALETDDLDGVMHEAVRRIADVLEYDYCKVLDLDAEREELLLRQGVGWNEGIVGVSTVSAVDSDSQAAYTLANEHPIVVENFETEPRFDGPDLLRNHDVRSGISTIIGPFDEPWGILGTHDTERREITEEDVTFVQSVANVLATAIARAEKERQLRERESQLDVATEAASIGLWTWDVQEDVVTADEYLAETYGMDPETITADAPMDTFYEPIHDDDTEQTRAELERAIEETGDLKAEYRVRDATGDVTWVEARGEVEYGVEGEPIRVHGAVADITERKRREQRLEELVGQLQESNERLEQFAYAASHDLQEPLRMISSYLRLIEQRYELDEEGEEFLEFAVDGADRMRSMIDGLLEYSRVETRGDPLETVDLETVLDDVREDLQVMIADSGATIEADPLPRVSGDPNQLRQVFQNLIDNAIEYSDERPCVHVAAERNGTDWTISVRDEGIGIDPEEQDRIFEVFQRGYDHDHGSGTGIGLALCERIVERHGGEIRVDSESGEGATFSFTLPAAKNR